MGQATKKELGPVILSSDVRRCWSFTFVLGGRWAAMLVVYF
jgi:hypothetical protein